MTKKLWSTLLVVLSFLKLTFFKCAAGDLKFLECLKTIYFYVYFKGSPTVTENSQFAAPKRPKIPPLKAETPKVLLGEMQQDAEDDGQDTDNEFPESDEMNQTGFSGEKNSIN